MRSVCKTALIAVLCLLLCTAPALADGGVTVSADFGYDGAVTYLSAMPLRVTLKNDGADTELTVAMLQLVASGRGVATLPLWAVQGYLDKGYVTARPIGQSGLTGRLYAASAPATSARPSS